MLSEIRQPQKDKYCMIPLYKEVKITETESRLLIARGWWEEGNGELSFQFYKMKRVLEINGGDGNTIL